MPVLDPVQFFQLFSPKKEANHNTRAKYSGKRFSSQAFNIILSFNNLNLLTGAKNGTVLTLRGIKTTQFSQRLQYERLFVPTQTSLKK